MIGPRFDPPPPAHSLDRTIRSYRSGKDAVDPWAPLGTLVEPERVEPGGPSRSLTVFLAGAECAFTCAHCDLWRYTLDTATPVGAIPSQIRVALEGLDPPIDRPGTRIKLYNASNFFDRRAVPPQDDPAIVRAVEGFGAVTVENHPRLVGERCFRFSEALGETQLEVALGLETSDPVALAGLNKKSDRGDFDQACRRLLEHDIDVRAFVLVGAPGVADPVADAHRSALHALEAGARLVALNPVRPGNGYLDHLATLGRWRPPTLREIEGALASLLSLSVEGIVTVDLWEIDRFRRCSACHDARVANLEAMNRSGIAAPLVACDRCEYAGESA